MSHQYQHAGMGGTFDRLHRGHHELLQTGLKSAKHLSIGITKDQFQTSKSYSQIITSYEVRERELRSYLKKLRVLDRVTTFPLYDVYGPTLTDHSIDCMVVTQHTLSGAKKINTKRRSLFLKPLPVIKAKLIKDQSGKYISSTRIRQGSIDRQGFVYRKILSSPVFINTHIRQKLKSPYGEVIQTKQLMNTIKTQKYTRISVVGDQTLHTFLQQNIPFHIGIFDNHIQRSPSPIIREYLSHNPSIPTITVKNPPGTIMRQSSNAIFKSISTSQRLVQVVGEEDVLVIPLILFEPLDSLVFYGQPNIGLVMIKVTEDIKQQMVKLLSLDD